MAGSVFQPVDLRIKDEVIDPIDMKQLNQTLQLLDKRLVSKFNVGSLGVPSLGFDASPATGFYEPATNQLALSCNGTLVWTATASAFTVALPITVAALTATGLIRSTNTTDASDATGTGAGAGAIGTLGGASIKLNLYVGGATVLKGAVNLGDAAGDNITVAGTITSNLIFTDNVYDIGVGSTRPRDFSFSRNGVIGGTLGVTGTTTLTGKLVGNLTGNEFNTAETVLSTFLLRLKNTDNTTGTAHAQFKIEVGGSSGGDPYTWLTDGNTSWSYGMDNSVAGDPMVWTASSTLGTAAMSLTTAGALTLAAGLTVAGVTTLQNHLLFTDNTYDIGASGANRVRSIYMTTLLSGSAATFSSGSASTTTSSGAVVVTGGVGIGGALWVGGLTNIAGNLTVTGAGTQQIGTTAAKVGIGVATPLWDLTFASVAHMLVDIDNAGTSNGNSVVAISTFGTTTLTPNSILCFQNKSQASGTARMAQLTATRVGTSTSALDAKLIFLTAKAGTLTEAMIIDPVQTVNFSGATSNVAAASGTLALRGGQIGFPATEVTSTDPNTLTDFQKGTFDIKMYAGATEQTLSTHEGTYVKIGNMVHVMIRCIVSSTSGTGDVTLVMQSDFPYNANQGNQYPAFSVFPYSFVNGFSWVYGQVVNGGKTIQMWQSNTSHAQEAVPHTQLQSGTQINLQFTMETTN